MIKKYETLVDMLQGVTGYLKDKASFFSGGLQEEEKELFMFRSEDPDHYSVAISDVEEWLIDVGYGLLANTDLHPDVDPPVINEEVKARFLATEKDFPPLQKGVPLYRELGLVNGETNEEEREFPLSWVLLEEELLRSKDIREFAPSNRVVAIDRAFVFIENISFIHFGFRLRGESIIRFFRVRVLTSSTTGATVQVDYFPPTTTIGGAEHPTKVPYIFSGSVTSYPEDMKFSGVPLFILDKMTDYSASAKELYLGSLRKADRLKFISANSGVDLVINALFDEADKDSKVEEDNTMRQQPMMTTDQLDALLSRGQEDLPVEAGEQYTLENEDSHAHDFDLPDPDDFTGYEKLPCAGCINEIIKNNMPHISDTDRFALVGLMAMAMKMERPD